MSDAQIVVQTLVEQIESLAAAGGGNAEQAFALLQRSLDRQPIVFSPAALLWAEAAKLRDDFFSGPRH
ncbi:hypothetical protein BKE38_14895 [Pseudoroseomonas deserti]|uniref:Uncharacterized protein n=1 Tax=Teichococcus deserti TaxID=1817963 RepID=A0A1V2H335_9PROT|nr:hypothetical protein [Pseudoroseomonas deserti]ONG52209.1 hypothetical protein BKE38_14895 [Pseudoroseomonas deserti]